MATMLEDHVRANRRATVRLFVILLLILWGVVFSIGWAMGYAPWITGAVGLVVAVVYLLAASNAGVDLILRAARARPANPAIREEQLLLHRVEEICIAAGLPMPKVYVQDDDDINAFAAGPSPQEAVVCVSSAALAQLDQEELQGVIAHEVAHIQNLDVRVKTYAVALIGTIAMVAEIFLRAMLFGGGRGKGGKGHPVLFVVALLFLVLAPILSRLTYLAISRRREFLADASGALLSRNPEGLARALEKIGRREPTPDRRDRTVASLYFVNPFKRRTRGSPWSTHPPIEERVRRLRGRPGP